MINIKNVQDRTIELKDTSGIVHKIEARQILTTPKHFWGADYLISRVECGIIIIFPNMSCKALENNNEELNDRFGLIDLEE